MQQLQPPDNCNKQTNSPLPDPGGSARAWPGRCCCWRPCCSCCARRTCTGTASPRCAIWATLATWVRTSRWSYSFLLESFLSQLCGADENSDEDEDYAASHRLWIFRFSRRANERLQPPSWKPSSIRKWDGMCSLGGEFRFQEKPLGQISMGSPTRGAAPLNPSDNPQA